METKTQNEVDLLQAFRDCSKEQQENIIIVAMTMAKKNQADIYKQFSIVK